MTSRMRAASCNSDDVVERLAVDEDEIGALAHLDGADLVGEAEQLGVGAGGGEDRRVRAEDARPSAPAPSP